MGPCELVLVKPLTSGVTLGIGGHRMRPRTKKKQAQLSLEGLMTSY